MRKELPILAFQQLDSNQDGALSFDEVLDADLLRLARVLKLQLFRNDPRPDDPIGSDEVVQATGVALRTPR